MFQCAHVQTSAETQVGQTCAQLEEQKWLLNSRGYNRMQDDLILVSVKAVNLIQMSFFDIRVIQKIVKKTKQSADGLTPNQHMIN